MFPDGCKDRGPVNEKAFVGFRKALGKVAAQLLNPVFPQRVLKILQVTGKPMNIGLQGL